MWTISSEIHNLHRNGGAYFRTLSKILPRGALCLSVVSLPLFSLSFVRSSVHGNGKKAHKKSRKGEEEEEDEREWKKGRDSTPQAMDDANAFCNKNARCAPSGRSAISPPPLSITGALSERAGSRSFSASSGRLLHLQQQKEVPTIPISGGIFASSSKLGALPPASSCQGCQAVSRRFGALKYK